MVLFSIIESETNSEDEGIDGYKIGGYHPTFIGEVLINRYVIIQKLGWGHFSTVWLARDFKHDSYVALKIQKSAPNYQEAVCIDAIQFYDRPLMRLRYCKPQKHIQTTNNGKNRLTPENHIVQLLNAFIHKGPFGNHFVMVFEILGVNLLEVIRKHKFQGIGLNQCKGIIRQILIGVDYLHRVCKIIHTDMKPENILVCLSQDEIKSIVETGQLAQNQQQQQRVKIYQSVYNLNTSSKEDASMNEILFQTQTDLTKQQKKQRKKKLQRKKKKLLVQQQQGIDSDPTSQFDDTSLSSQFNNGSQNILQNINSKNNEINKNFLDKKILKVKIADLGNACWINHHFSDTIQTRYYRAPEVIIGAHYDQSADIWSVACMIFEILTGDFLFDPKKGPSYSKNDDHLAQIQELLGKFPLSFSQVGTKSKKYFTKAGNLRRIDTLQQWPLQDVLMQKQNKNMISPIRYKIKSVDANQISDFLFQMLNPVPYKRASAYDLLSHPWLNNFSQRIQPRNLQLSDSSDEVQDSSHQVQEDQNLNYFRLSTRKVEDLKLIDASFSDLNYRGIIHEEFYLIGYGEGIDFENLDLETNFKFLNIKE